MAAGSQGVMRRIIGDALVARYYMAVPDASRPRMGWYVQVREGIPIGPFPDQDRAEAAVEALTSALNKMSTPAGGA